MRVSTNVSVIVIGALVLAGCVGTSVEEPDDPGAAIRAVLEEDTRLGGVRNLASESGPLAGGIRAYVNSLDAIDFSDCPAEFTVAFGRHRDAWSEAIPFFERHDTLRGELHDVFEQIREIRPEDRTRLEGHEKAIRDTWTGVQAVVARYDPKASQEIPDVEVTTWGSMREVLRQGRTEARVELLEVAMPNSIGVGALVGLEGEITIVDGDVTVSMADGEGRIVVRDAIAGDQATLLVLADVPSWQEVPLGDVAGYEQLDHAIAERLTERGRDLNAPTPVRVHGRAPGIQLHVVAGACPIANPDGPPPSRYSGPAERVELAGFYAENAASELTHHHRNSHLHALVGPVMGHLDDVFLEDAVLMVPAAE